MPVQQSYDRTDLEFVAEPDTAFSRACVGTHEYLAPEIASGVGHGNSVDWWAFGVFIYELIYGRTPFKGGSKKATLKNVLVKELKFPNKGANCAAAAAAKDLINRLLERDPRRRLGSAKGAAEIKRHPFFRGIQWPLIRSMLPPVLVVEAGAAVGTFSGASKRRWRWKWSSRNRKRNDKSIV